jgi:hypothetical protein
MYHCAFCGLGPPRREHFFTGPGGVAICDCCTEVAIELAKVPRADAPGAAAGADEVGCGFCERTRSQCRPGLLVGAVSSTFICLDCERLAADELGVV